jgi:hypothetical protein
LVIVLLMLVLATVLVVTFAALMTSNHSVASARVHELQASEIGKGGIDWAAGQLRKEAMARDPLAAAANMVPDRTSAKDSKGTASAIKNLIKRTDRTIPFHPAGSVVAAASSSLTPASGGRKISVERWMNGPRLCGTATGIGAAATEFTAPDWVYMTGTGPRKVTLPADLKEIVGRFAVAVYDVGGLADVNIMGTEPATVVKGSVPVAVLQRKGSPRLVSLSKTPGFPMFPATANGRDELAMANLIHRFREPGTLAKGGSDGSGWLGDITSAGRIPDADPASRYIDFMDVMTRGGAKILEADARFLSRQDMLTFWKRTELPTEALPFLTIFSREANRPNFSPRTLTPPVTDATRDFSAFDDATAAAKFRRFNLQRLNDFEEFKQTGSSESRARILTHFGLQPEGPVPGTRDGRLKMVWKYKAGAIAARTPGENADFFETLKMAFKPQSLAKTAITQGFYTRGIDNSITYDLDKKADLQIMRIGANVMDQWDRDGWPTFIRFDFPVDPVEIDHTAAQKSADRIVAGVENLPYLNRAITVQRRYNTLFVAVYYTFEIWNPHGNSATPPAEHPTDFEIVPSGQTKLFVSEDDVLGPGETLQAESPFAPLVGGVQFSGVPAIEPTYLDATTNATVLHPSGSDAGSMTPLGIRGVGQAMRRGDKRHGTNTRYVQQIYVIPKTNEEPGFSLRVQGMNVAYSSFRLLQRIPDMGVRDTWPLGTAGIDIGKTLFSSNINAPGRLRNPTNDYDYRYHHGFLRADPRTSRFGAPALRQVIAGSTCSFPGQGIRPSGAGVVSIFMDPSSTPAPPDPDQNGNGWTLSANADPWTGAKGRAYGLLAENGPASATRYTDPDGELRWGDNQRAFTVSATNNLFAPGKTELRPVMLDRPFRSIGELGFVFRDVPWKTLDFSNANSADQALLDFFTIEGDPMLDDSLGAPPKMLHGRIDLNTPHPEILAAALEGAGKTKLDGPPLAGAADTITALEARTIATAFVQETRNNPLRNKGEAVRVLAALPGSTLPAIKAQREVAARALVGPGQVGTWNVMIDVIAQSGIYPPGSTNLDSNFVIRGERRYWLHLAIDRYTGEVLDQMLETVTD